MNITVMSSLTSLPLPSNFASKEVPDSNLREKKNPDSNFKKKVSTVLTFHKQNIIMGSSVNCFKYGLDMRW